MAIRAVHAGVHQASDTHHIADLEFLDLIADRSHPADDFMAGHVRVGGVLPFVPHRMQIGVTDAAIQNFYLHIVRQRIAALKLE